MTVRVNKDSFNLREKLSELERPIGLKGSELMGAETAQEARDLVSAGRKNMVINGDMRVFQRNNSGNVPNTGTYFLDRFQARENSGGVLYITQQSSNTGGPPGFRSWLLAQCDGADTSVDSNDYVRIQQYIEGYNCFMDWGYGNTDYVTASFWVKSNKTGIYCFQIEDSTGVPLYSQEYSIDQLDVWQKVVLTVPPPPSGTWRSADNGIGARLTWTLMAGSGHPTTANVWQTGYGMRTDNQVNFMDNANNNFYLTGVQLEVGKNATDFEHRPYGEELALCQRYYYEYPKGNTYNIIANGLANTSNNSLFHFQFPVPMRAAPVVATTGSWQVIDGTSHTISSFSAITDATELTGRVDATTINSNLTAGKATMLRNNNDATARFAFNAEL